VTTTASSFAARKSSDNWPLANLSDGWFALLAFVITVAVNTLIVLLFRSGGFGAGTLEYDEIARNLAAGNGFVLNAGDAPILWRPPLYIYGLACFYRLFEHPYWLVVGAQVLISGASGVLIFLVGRRVFGRAVGLGAAVLTAGYPVVASNCLRLMPETVFVFLLLLTTVLVIACFQRPRVSTAVAIGVVVGLAALTKAVVQFLPVFLMLWALLFAGRGLRLRQSGMFLISFVVMVAVVAPWSWRNHRQSGEFVFIDTSGGYTFWVGNRLASHGLDDDPLSAEEFTEVKRDIARILDLEYTPDFNVATTAWASESNSKKLYKEAIRNMIEHPVASLWLMLRKLGRFWLSYTGRQPLVQVVVFLLQIGILLPACAGFWFAWKSRVSAGPLVPMLIYFPLLHMASTANVRYSVSVLPLVMLFAVYGVFAIRRTWVNRYEKEH
jgi:4-amino-4-deoxy-L-arabinose transferase-like glycosyltransferase